MIEPDYYSTEYKNLDVIDIAKMLDLNFNKGNVLKYMVRAGRKEDERADIEKAITYLTRELEYLEEESFSEKREVQLDSDLKANIEPDFKVEEKGAPKPLESPLNFNTVIEILNTAEKQIIENNEIREGQAIMNTLAADYPGLHSLVTGTVIDPYYDNDNLQSLLLFLVGQEKSTEV